MAAPVIWSREVIKDHSVAAVLLNSGGANACTGPEGFADTHQSAEAVAETLGISASDTAICSTGLIGVRLPMDAILSGVGSASQKLSGNSLLDLAEAIMTTDSKPKISRYEVNGATIVGIAKGAGMLAPALATMLSVIMTDAIVDEYSAKLIFEKIVDRTFNRIDSDGCTSTNDTVLFMSSGASGVEISDSDLEDMLMQVCGSLSAQLIADAEGSSKTVAIKVLNASSDKDAVEVGRACARNNLLKAAIFGGDPNWGRVLAAVGTADADMDPLAIDVKLNGVQVCTNSAPDADKSTVNFDARLVEIEIDLKIGTATATIMTNDLTHDYVHENSAYST